MICIFFKPFLFWGKWWKLHKITIHDAKDDPRIHKWMGSTKRRGSSVIWSAIWINFQDSLSHRGRSFQWLCCHLKNRSLESSWKMFALIYREGRRNDTMFVQESQESSSRSSSCKRWWISNTKPQKTSEKLFNLFRYCCQTIAKLRQLFDAVVAVDPHYTWRSFVFSSQQFLMHIKDFSVCLIIIIMHFLLAFGYNKRFRLLSLLLYCF